MMVIAKDNFAREYVSERVVALNLNEFEATQKAKQLNAESGEGGWWFYEAKPDTYRPYTFNPL